MTRSPRIARFGLPALLALGVILPASLTTASSGCTLKEAPPPSSAPGAIPPPPDVAAAPADALTTPSGIKSKMLRVGVGSIKPTMRSTVVVHYTGWTTDGEMFDSSILRGDPITFTLAQVIPGWQEGLQLMVSGEKRRFWIPAELAYGNSGANGSPKGTLVFEIELLSVR